MTRRRRASILSAAGLILAGVVAVVAVVTTGASGAGDYRTALSTTATVEQTLSVTGTVVPVNKATADFQVSGTVSAVNVAVGQTVSAGQTLASLATTTLQQNVSSAQLKLSADQAKLSEDESSASTTTTTTSTTTPTGGTGSTGAAGSPGHATPAASGAGAANDSPQQLATDQAAIDSDQAALIGAQQSLADAQLKSPIAGLVASVGLAVGQSVTAGSASQTISVIDTGAYAVSASLASSQSAAVHVGDEASVTIDGTSGPVVGTVSRVGPVNTSASGDTYPMIVALSPGSHGIAAGSTAEVQVVLRHVDHALAVPTSAVS
ncbi:MAG TPA: HlyD family efflux transporter periplasmic adaptor subunit, partial [Acidimicrobiales bacterium]|nr:HlyD family efflux transporter periplasmic adaptor subunit [Acidimicrobiales bacterium]